GRATRAARTRGSRTAGRAAAGTSRCASESRPPQGRASRRRNSPDRRAATDRPRARSSRPRTRAGSLPRRDPPAPRTSGSSARTRGRPRGSPRPRPSPAQRRDGYAEATRSLPFWLAHFEASVRAAEVEQRVAVEAGHLFDPPGVNDVVARGVCRDDAAVDVDGDAAQERRARAPGVELEPVEALVFIFLYREPVRQLL